jgi:signal transduction histidine kinase
LIDQLLDFTRARVGGGFELRPADANLATICQQVLSEIQLAHPDWKVSVESAGEVGGYWDADRLLQVVSNLATNAGQHGTPGAPIRVKLDGTNAQLVALEIHNEGSISSDLLPNIFSPFKGTREFGSDGLGLGAFITREIVQAHGGTVDVRSSDDEGTTFTVRLPRRIVAPSS